MRYLNARNTAFGEDRKVYSTVDSTASAGQTVFNVSYDQGRVAVFLNGIRLVPAQDYTYTLSGLGTNITLGAGITANDYLELIGLQGINAGNAVTEDNFVVGTSSTGSGGSYTNSTTVFPVSSSAGDLVSVWRNGIKLVPTTDFTVNATANTVTLQSASNTADEITVHVVGILQHSNFVQTTGGTFTGNVAMTGDLTVDTNTLKIDSSNNRVGIGTASPSSTLTVKGTLGLETTDSTNRWNVYAHTDDTLRLNYNGAGNDEVVVKSSGEVGIGTASPADKMELSHNGTLGLRIRNTNNSGYSQIIFGTGSSASSFCTIRHERSGADQGKLHITKPNDGSGGDAFTINHLGNVGIGETSPSYPLTLQTASSNTTHNNGNNLYLNTTAPLLSVENTNSTDNNILGGIIANASGWYAGGIYFKGVSHSSYQSSINFATRNGGSFNDKMTIRYDGLVGIGTDAPQKHLEVHDTSNIAYLLINGGGGDGSMTSALQLGGRSASGGNQLAEVSAIRIGDTRGQLVFSTKSSANTLTQRGCFYHGGRSDAREQAFAIQNKRIIYNWYDVTGTNQTYKHIKTSLWMGGTHSNSYGFSGNSYYWMGGWRIYGYRYTPNNAIADTSFFFHNWSGGFSHPEIQDNGGWQILSGYYTSSDGFCVLRLFGNTYSSVHMDMFQVFAAYPFRDVYVFSETNTNSSSAQF